MNTLDIIILVIILLLAFLGYKKGFLVSVFSLISIIIGLVLATKFHSGFALVLGKFIKDTRLLNLVSFVVIFLAIYFAGVFIAGKLSGINKFTKSFDKILGLILGTVKGLLVASLIIIFLKSFGVIGENEFGKSLIYPYVNRFAPDTFDTVSKVLPFKRKSFDDLNSFLKLDSLYVK